MSEYENQTPDVEQIDNIAEPPAETNTHQIPTEYTSDEVIPTRTIKPYKKTNERVTMTKPVVSEPDNNHGYYTFLPSATTGELSRRPGTRVHAILNEKIKPERENDVGILSMVMHTMLGDSFSNSFVRENSDWQQTIEQDGQSFSAAKPRFKSPDKGTKLSTSDAARKLDSLFGMGGYVTIPLIHSGIWVTLKPITAGEFAFLNEKIAIEKNEFGKQTIGMIFSNNKVYTLRYLMEFIVEHIHDTTLKGWTPETLLKLIKMTDLPALINGALHCMYPNGFNYASPCTADDACGKMTTYKLKPINMTWYDRTHLDKKAKRFMLERTVKREVTEIESYQSMVERNDDNKLVVEDVVEVYYTVPSIAEHIRSGYKWFEDIETIINNNLGEDLTFEQRRSSASQHLTLSTLRQYGHFFKTIKFLDDDTFVEAGDDLDDVLNRLSTVGSITDKIIEGIGKFIDSQSLVVVGIPRVPCPHCSGENTTDIEKHPYIIPIDVMSLFFTMGELKTRIGSLV